MNYEQYVKSQMQEKEWSCLQRLELNLDSKILAEIWPDFVNFEKRGKSEIPFLLSHLKEYEDPKVFDACLGSGATTIGLKLAGINNVVSNEIDEDFIRIAQEEARKSKVQLNTTSYDWRELNGKCPENFDVVPCLGNSLTYLFRKDDQLKTLENFRSILKPNGKLIIDERNYAEHFLRGKYRFSGNIVYCGKEKVDAYPIFISENMVVMEYTHKQRGEKAHLVLYPFKKSEFRELLEEVRFRDIQIYGDYKKNFDPKEPEFITYVCRR